MRVCVSISPSSTKDALEKLTQASRQADLVELRIDGASKIDLTKILCKPQPEIIITNRRRDEGGLFDGTVKEQLQILANAMKLGAEYVDIEASWGAQAIRQLLFAKNRSRVIISYHNFQEIPRNLRSVYNKLVKLNGDILKIVTMANDITDNKIIFDLLSFARTQEQPIIAFCMGKHGEISRILGGKFGCELMYAASTPSKSTAPGQLTAFDLKSIFGINTINKQTRVFGLIGNPVSHSRGILYHNRIFRQHSVNAVYVNFLVTNLQSFFPAFRSLISGVSVTMPFKSEVLPLLDHIDNEAQQLSSVNTIIMRRGRAIGYNTDLPALLSLLKKRTTLKRKRILVLGTGATSTTMIHAMARSGAHVVVAGRSSRKTKSLASAFNCDHLALDELDTRTFDIIMNGTPVGMDSCFDRQLVPKQLLRKGTIVFDAVYSPPVTPLLRAAKRAGCKTISGMEFFEAQAKLQSQLFLKTIR